MDYVASQASGLNTQWALFMSHILCCLSSPPGSNANLTSDLPVLAADSPGFNINFESAPFKLTKEYLDLLGGPDSEDFKLFQDLFLRGFLALQKHIDGITSIIQVPTHLKKNVGVS